MASSLCRVVCCRGFVLGADPRARFVLVVSMQVVALIEVRVGDRGRWLRHRKGAGETPDESPVAMPVGGPFRCLRQIVLAAFAEYRYTPVWWLVCGGGNAE